MKTITFITGNKNKLQEVLKIIDQNDKFQIVHKKIDLPEYQGSLEFIVEEKCKAAAEAVQGPVLVEDTSLNLEAWNGLPGPYIKWFVESIGANGLFRMIKDWQCKNATGICMMAFTEGINQPVHIFKGIVEGQLVEPRGSFDFGWDPCFQPNGFDKTFGEMDASLKNQISHRYKCTIKLKEFLENLN